MDLIRAMTVFARVADSGSFASASRALDLAPAVVTRVVAELEEHLGARLIHRTTRRMALTEVGEDYLASVRAILADVDAAHELAQSSTGEPRGVLKLLCPPALAVHQLAKLLPEFHRRYPMITVELSTPGPVATIDEAFDLTLVLTGRPIDGDFVARRLARSELVLCAAPEYLDARGRPEHPEDLRGYDAVLPPGNDLARGITFVRVPSDARPEDDCSNAETITLVPQRPLLTASHADVMYAAALHGLGVVGLPSFMVEDALHENALERVLPDWRLFSVNLWAMLPTRKHLPLRTRVMLDYLVEAFGGADRDPWLAAAAREAPAYADAAAAQLLPRAGLIG